MLNNNLSRLGGIAAILGILLSIGYVIHPAFMALGALALAIFIFALFSIFKAESAWLSLVGAVVGIAGAVLLTIQVLFAGTQNSAMQNLSIWAVFLSPPLFYGTLAYLHPQAGMPRILALIGILGGVGGLLNIILTLIGGGDWSNPNNPTLSPLIMGTYYFGMLLTLIWIVWTAIVLLRRRA